jgi:hypothetical protein
MNDDFFNQIFAILNRQQAAGYGAPSFANPWEPRQSTGSGPTLWSQPSSADLWAPRKAPTLDQLSFRPGNPAWQPRNLSWNPSDPQFNPSRLSARPGQTIASLDALSRPASSPSYSPSSPAYDPSRLSEQPGQSLWDSQKRKAGWSL